MKKIKVFISYSHLDGAIAGKIKTIFAKYFGFESFLAHDDLSVSDNFPKEVLRYLRKSDYVVPLISKNFKMSDFANQEIGLALAYGKKIIPISIDDMNPSGFISPIHAYKCKNIDEDELIKAITSIYYLAFTHPHYRQYRDRSIESIVDAFCLSTHFKITSLTIDVCKEISKIIKLNSNQLSKMVKAIKENYEIYGADLVMPKIKDFLKNTYKITIDN